MTALAGQQDRVEAEDVLDRSEVWWLQLREIIRTGSLKRGDFVLSSGPYEHHFISAPADSDAEGTRGAHWRNHCRIRKKP